MATTTAPRSHLRRTSDHPASGQSSDEDVDRLAAGRDRVIDLARAVSMIAVAVGHWLVTDVRPTPDGGLALTDALAELPELQALTWLFQVMPVFFFAGGVAGFRSWARHRAEGAPAGSWVATRLWRLAWPTLPVVGFWVAATQLGDHLLGLPDSILAASQGIALVVWFLAVYALVVACIPILDRACAHWGLRAPIAMLVAAGVVDLVVTSLGRVPAWSLVNYLLVWGAVTSLGRWWPRQASPAHRPVGLAVAAGALGLLVGAVVTGMYPLSMVGVAGAERSNSWPPTVALALLGLVQVGLLVLARDTLDRWLSDTGRYRVVGMFGARAMTIYLWHTLAQAVLVVALVLPGAWPTAVVGSAAWWGLRIAWVAACVVFTVPVVLVAGRWERPPAWTLTTSTRAAVVATIGLATGWTSLALQGFHVPAMPLSLPLVTVAGLVTGLVALCWHGHRPGATPPGATRVVTAP